MFENQQQSSKPLTWRRFFSAPWEVWPGFRHRLGVLRWLVPAGLMLLVIVYELGPARWLFNLGLTYHLAGELALFAAIGPLLAFLGLDLLWRWLDERDTSDLQGQLLTQAREDKEKSRRLCDDALQTLFAASAVIHGLKATHPEASPELTAELERTEAALNQTIQRLRDHLES